jgi:hypothetical protein
MIANFFTKPLQGALFQKFRKFIMNVDPLTNSPRDHRSVLRNIEVPKGPNGGAMTWTEPVAVAGEPQDKSGNTNEWTKVKRTG